MLFGESCAQSGEIYDDRISRCISQRWDGKERVWEGERKEKGKERREVSSISIVDPSSLLEVVRTTHASLRASFHWSISRLRCWVLPGIDSSTRKGREGGR